MSAMSAHWLLAAVLLICFLLARNEEWLNMSASINVSDGILAISIVSISRHCCFDL